MADWEIRKSTGLCSGSGRAIELGQEYFAALVETDQGFERHDYCIEYWLENKPQVFYFWKTKLCDPDKKKKVFIDDDMLKAFFDRLEGESDTNKINFRFVMALVLMRKRILKYDSSRVEDGREIWTMKVACEKRTVDVVNPELSEDQIESLTENIGQIMQMDYTQ